MRIELSRCEREIEALIADVRALLEPLTDDEVRRQPAPGRWSVSQCLDHLVITAHMYEQALREAAAIPNQPAATPDPKRPYRPSWFWRWMVKQAGPSGKRRVKTAPAFYPHEQRPKSDLEADFAAAHRSFLASLLPFDSLDLGKAKVTSPFVKWLKFPAGMVLELVPAHARRHLLQAAEAVTQRGPQ